MIEYLALAFGLMLVNQVLFGLFHFQRRGMETGFLNLVYVYHVFFALVYYYYVQNNASDSYYYFEFVSTTELTWFELLGETNGGVHFLSYPFVRLLGMSYEMTMAQFSWLGYWGFVFAYEWFRENVTWRPQWFGFDLLSLIILFPNMHFWSGSLGKGSLVFLGLMLVAYGVLQPRSRWQHLGLGAWLLLTIRPHVALCMAAAVVGGNLMGHSHRTSLGTKALIVAAGACLFVWSAGEAFNLAKIESDNAEQILDELTSTTAKRADDLARAGSGVDMNSYSYPVRLFTIWFRPLFVDSPNFLGHFSSFENVIYLLLFANLLNVKFPKFLVQSDASIKFALLAFGSISLALAMVMSNLGIILRQKAMVMYFGFFVVYQFMSYLQSTRQEIAYANHE